mmetsp:Transcript_14634/g.40502  ORF Transcript_14634/g.40502 Transcript_14634/m.40502 type:complete len:80 (-) Transcript_14634:442-681(-)
MECERRKCRYYLQESHANGANCVVSAEGGNLIGFSGCLVRRQQSYNAKLSQSPNNTYRHFAVIAIAFNQQIKAAHTVIC